MIKKIPSYFFIIIFFLYSNNHVFSEVKNSIIISVGNYPITRLDLFNEIKLIAILSNTEINNENKEQIKALAVKSLIKRNIKRSEIQKRNIRNYNRTQLNSMLGAASQKIGVDKNGLKEILQRNNLNYERLVKRFETDLKWNYMIFEIYKNKISLNTTEIESKLQSRLEATQKTNGIENLDNIKDQIIATEKEKKLKMFSNLHYSNLERSIQIKFL